MQISEAVRHMTKQYLGRILDSFTKDIGPQEEEEARDYITRNSEELADPDNVARRLDLFELSHSERVLVYFVLETMLNAHDCALTERQLVERTRDRERELVEAAESDDALQYAEDRAVDIMRTVLETAFEDDELSRDEYRLIQKLRDKLGLTRRQQRLLEARLDAFPKADGEPHSSTAINDMLLHLQKQGVLFYCNRVEDDRSVVLPEELQPGVKRVLGIELSENARELLWQNLPTRMLKKILRAQNLPVYGTKDEMVDRIIASNIKPSEGLTELTSDNLYDTCNKLPGVTVSGTKQERIDRIVNHFDNLMIRDLPDETEEGERFYEYLVQLAERDRENLLANDVISKDRDIDNAFEEGTRYLFQHRLGLPLEDMNGNDHPDGLMLTDDGDYFMWDNKSKDGEYRFPNSHLRQFKRYIRDTIDHRVTCFLIVVPDVEDQAVQNCKKLKHETSHDTDVAIISAENLKWIAENWSDHTGADSFNLAVFDDTGILKRDDLELNMDVLM
jgi:hypothetical protein